MAFLKENAINYHQVKLVIPSQVYAPAEDTDLILKHLLKWIEYTIDSPRILEIGVGPGSLLLNIISELIQKKKNPRGIGIDLNAEAVGSAIFNGQINGLFQYCQFFLGNLFQPLESNKLTELFDLIFFNPPYLASESDTITESNRQAIDDAWDGGAIGDEVIVNFLEQAPRYLSTHGDLFFLSSSSVDQSRILSVIDSNYMKIVETDRVHIFFEDILLYHLVKQ